MLSLFGLNLVVLKYFLEQMYFLFVVDWSVLIIVLGELLEQVVEKPLAIFCRIGFLFMGHLLPDRFQNFSLGPVGIV